MTVNFNGKAYELTQEPYITGTVDAPHYEASATCASHDANPDGEYERDNSYTVRWDAYDANADDDSINADWENPTAVWHYSYGQI